jgi:hypothetical protein
VKLKRSSLNRLHVLGTLLMVSVLVGLWIYVNFGDAASFYTIRYDPEYPYFLNSLAVFKGRTYEYMDHPGTSIEIIGSALLVLTYFIAQHPTLTFVQYHIQNPQVFLIFARTFMTVTSILCLVLLSIHAVKRKRSLDVLVSLAIPASFFALHPPFSFTSAVFWAHNSFAFPLGTLILLLLLIRLRADQRLRWWETSLFGFGAGLLCTFQLWFATWVIGVGAAIVLYFSLRRDGWLRTLFSPALVGAGALTGFVTGTLPSIHKYLWFAYWVKSLLFHTGRYGNGPAGFTTPTLLVDNFQSLFKQAPVILLATLATFILVAAVLASRRKRLRDDPANASLILGLSIQLAVLLLIVFKHPGRHYLLGAAAIIPVLFAALYDISNLDNKWVRRVAAGLSILLLVGFVIGLIVSIKDHHWRVTNINIAETQLEVLKEEQARLLEKDPDELLIHWGYGTGSPCYALYFGNKWTGWVFSDEINEICPRDKVYSVWGSDVELQPYGKWDIIVVPENYVPEEADQHGRLVVSEAQTEKYGRIVFILSRP